MTRDQLASKLIAARSAHQRRRLLEQNAAAADERLAQIIKNICYDAWTSTPVIAQKAAHAAAALAEFSSDPAIKPYESWLSGIADITRGRLETSIISLERSSSEFAAIGREHESAQPQVARLMALAMTGRYDEAITAGKTALKIFNKFGDQLAAGKIEMNLSNIVSRRGRHRDAERFCLSAHRRFAQLGEHSWQAMAENGLANTYAELNDFRTAEKYYSTALRTAREAAMAVTEAEIEASMGNLALFRGKYGDALTLLETSRRRYAELGMPHQIAIAELEIAEIYLELNLASDAFDLYESLAPQLRRLKLRGEEARARANFGRAAAVLGKTDAARRELRTAERLYKAERNMPGIASVLLSRAKLELSLGQFKKAIAAAGAAADIFNESENIRGNLSASLIAGEAAAGSGDGENARQILDQALTEAAKFEQIEVQRSALNLLGVIARQNGNNSEAEKLFKNSIALVEDARTPLPSEEFRMSFLADKLGAYENLANLYLQNKNTREGFEIVERSRSRSLLDSITGSGTNRGQAPENLRTALSTLREELNWFYSRLDRAGDDESKKLAAEAQLREKKIAAIMRQIGSTATTRSETGTGAFDLPQLQTALGEKRAFVEFVKFDGVFSAFVITDDSIEYVPAIAAETTVAEILESLHFQFGAMRYGPTAGAKFHDQLKRRADSHLEKLYDLLLRPLELYIGDRDIIVSPAGNLYYVPFHALKAGCCYVIESREIVYSPGASIWQAMNARPERKLNNSLLVGYADETIPMVEHEIEELGDVVKQPKILSGGEATFAAFTRSAPDFDLLHIACHGRFRPDNPLFSSLHLADGWVTVRDITTANLRAELVTLSACETGLSKVFAGDEILGLARGFLSAGAGALVLSLWAVNDRAALSLMKNFYEELQRGQTIAASLRTAQLNFIDRGEHPYFWSPFLHIGT